MRIREYVLNPAFLMVILAGAYVLLRVPQSQQLGTFATLSTITVGAAELVAGIRFLLGTARRAAITHLAIGVGFLMVGISSTIELTILSIIGSLVIIAGFLYGSRQGAVRG